MEIPGRRKNWKSGKVLPFVILVFLSLLFFVSIAFGETISSSEARNHIGEYQTVKGTIVSTHYARTSRGEPTFLNMDKPYPNQVFTILIWGSDRNNFPGNPEIYYDRKVVLVEGVISQYKGVPQVIISSSSQITIVQ